MTDDTLREAAQTILRLYDESPVGGYPKTRFHEAIANLRAALAAARREPVGEADAAWLALREEVLTLAANGFSAGSTANAVDHHRPVIEAAIRGREGLDVGLVAETFRLMREEDDLPDSSASDEFVAKTFIERYERLTPADGEERDRD